MKGIETLRQAGLKCKRLGSDHCPAMKGIETRARAGGLPRAARSDHCPAMKGIETRRGKPRRFLPDLEATTAPQ